MAQNRKERQPWPMKWVVLSIILFIIPYTYLTLKYRKPGKAFEPYADMKDRANTMRLLSAGFQRVEAQMQRPDAPMRFALSAPTQTKPGGLVGGLKETLVEKPLLPSRIGTVHAPGIINSGSAYSLEFTCILSDQKRAPLDAQVYIRNDEIVIVPDFEKLADGLSARRPDSLIRVTIPASAFKPGSYSVTLIGEAESKGWALQVH